MWWLSLSPFIVPASAAVAGIFTWLMTRNDRPADGDLLRHFLVALGMVLLVSAGVMQIDVVRDRFDPGTKARAAFGAQPLNEAWRRHFPNEWAEVEKATDALFREGKSLEAVESQARGLHPLLARKHLPDSQQQAVTLYAQALLPVMRELQRNDPSACVRVAWRHVSGQPFDYGARVSPGARSNYESAIARVLVQNSKAREARWSPEPGASTRQASEAWARIVADMPPRYANLLAALHTPAVTQFDAAVVCDASMQVIAKAAELPPPVARQLLVMLLAGT